ncbi:MAG: glycerophosphodiester phosphodiesterase family protein [Bacteroidia bacterium]
MQLFNCRVVILFVYVLVTVLDVHAQISFNGLLADSSKKVLVAAHRGDWKNYPENSIPAVLSCIRVGIDIVEIDVQETRDGKFVLMHDNTVNRTTNGKGKVSNLTSEHILKLRLKNRFNELTEYTVPSLDTILQLTKGKIIVNIDKSAGKFDKLIPIIKKYKCGSNVILKGTGSYKLFNDYQLNNIDSICFMPIFNSKNESIDTFLIQTRLPVVELMLSNDTSYASKPKGLEMFRRNNCRIWYNALFESISGGHNESKNAIESWEWFIQHDAYIIQTDFPFHLMSYCVSKGLRPPNPLFQLMSLTELPKLDSKVNSSNSIKNKDSKSESDKKTSIRKPQKSSSSIYIVKSGDTLSKIASKNDISLKTLLKLNSTLKKDSKIYPGQKIKIR